MSAESSDIIAPTYGERIASRGENKLAVCSRRANLHAHSLLYRRADTAQTCAGANNLLSHAVCFSRSSLLFSLEKIDGRSKSTGSSRRSATILCVLINQARKNRSANHVSSVSESSVLGTRELQIPREISCEKHSLARARFLSIPRRWHSGWIKCEEDLMKANPRRCARPYGTKRQ